MWSSTGTEKSFSFTTRFKVGIQEKSYTVVVEIVSMSNYTILTPYDNHLCDFKKNFRKPISREK